MSITPDDLLAQASAFPRDTELSVRVTVNRAYYAAFHAAYLFHKTLPAPGKLPSTQCGVHETLYHQLKCPTIPAAEQSAIISKRLGIMGTDLKAKRKLADYDLGCEVSVSDAEYAISQARKVLELTKAQ